MKIVSFLVIPLGLMLGSCTPELAGPKKIVIVGARLDGMEHSIVIVEGMTILAAGPQSSVPLPKDSDIVDGMGKTIVAAAGTRLQAGQVASLILKDASSERVMKDGRWQN